MGNVIALKLAPEENIIRHTVLNTLRALNAKHRKQYGEMVLCCDSYSWRRDYYEQYKYSRRANRDATEEDATYWKQVFEILSTIREEIETHMPWKLLHIHGAEADDIIATLAQSTQEFGKAEDVLIWSSDSDFRQLHKYPNVKQYALQQKKWVKEADPHRWLFDAIVTGQGGKDGIPNIRTHDDFFVEKVAGAKVRQATIMQKTKDYWWDNRRDLESVMTGDEYRNFIRNRTLIDLDCIPWDLQTKITDAYDNYNTPDGKGLLTYLASKRCRQLMDKIEDFR